MPRRKDEIRRYVSEVIEMNRAWDAAREAALVKLEAEGYRIIAGGGYGPPDYAWEITDHRTGEVLASGSGDAEYAAEEEAAEELNEQQPIYHADPATEDVGLPDYPYPPPGIPGTLADALRDWVDAAADDAAAWVTA